MALGKLYKSRWVQDAPPPADPCRRTASCAASAVVIFLIFWRGGRRGRWHFRGGAACCKTVWRLDEAFFADRLWANCGPIWGH